MIGVFFDPVMTGDPGNMIDDISQYYGLTEIDGLTFVPECVNPGSIPGQYISHKDTLGRAGPGSEPASDGQPPQGGAHLT